MRNGVLVKHVCSEVTRSAGDDDDDDDVVVVLVVVFLS